MWPFKQPAVMDTEDTIFLADDGSVFYPLNYNDQEVFNKSVEKIMDLLRLWMVQDISFSTKHGAPIDQTLVYQLMNVDLKFLGYGENLFKLQESLKDISTSASGSRLFDAFVRIAMQVPIEIQRVITGRFLYGHIYCLQKEINNINLPSKKMWLEALQQAPWIVYLPFLQELYDEDDVVSKVTELQQTNHMRGSTVNVVSQMPTS